MEKLERLLEERGRIIANVKFVMQGKKEVPYISPKGYSIIDIELLYYAITWAIPSVLEEFKKTGRMPFSDGYIDISKRS